MACCQYGNISSAENVQESLRQSNFAFFDPSISQILTCAVSKKDKESVKKMLNLLQEFSQEKQDLTIYVSSMILFGEEKTVRQMFIPLQLLPGIIKQRSKQSGKDCFLLQRLSLQLRSFRQIRPPQLLTQTNGEDECLQRLHNLLRVAQGIQHQEESTSKEWSLFSSK
jgi:hypothetical protein